MKEFKFKIDGTEYAAQVEEQDENKVQVTVNGKAYSVDVEGMAAPKAPVARPTVGQVASAAPAAGSASAKLSAPLPGNITKILVKEGDKVKKGDTIIIMEAMKMENNITAEADCTIQAIKCQVGQTVNQGDVLAELSGIANAAPAPKAAPVAAPAPKAAPAAAPKAAAPAGGKAVTAPLPGTVTAVKVTVGQTVKKGDIVAVMEAMKMQNDIVSEWDGTVSAINAQQGASVNVGDALVTIA